MNKPAICIGHHTIDRLMAGETVEIDAAIMIPASDLAIPKDRPMTDTHALGSIEPVKVGNDWVVKFTTEMGSVMTYTCNTREAALDIIEMMSKPLAPTPSHSMEETKADAIWHDLTFIIADFLELRDEALEPGEADEEERQASAEHLVDSLRSALSIAREGQ